MADDELHKYPLKYRMLQQKASDSLFTSYIHNYVLYREKEYQMNSIFAVTL